MNASAANDAEPAIAPVASAPQSAVAQALEVLHGSDDDGGPARAAAAVVDGAADAPSALAALVAGGLAVAPVGGAADVVAPGATWRRFRLLAEVAATDLSTARLLEGHLDATTILAELGAPAVDPSFRLGVWASKAGPDRLTARPAPGGWRLDGELAYCSGATCLDAALVVADAGGDDRLFLVDLGRSGVNPRPGTWPAVGMAGSISGSVGFDRVRVPDSSAIGGGGDYTGRPGFRAGAIGVASCWAGGALGIARVGLRAAEHREGAHDRAHLGSVVSAWAAMWSLLASAARSIDDGTADEVEAQVVRHQVEAGCQQVVEHVGRLAGPGPMVHDPAHARRVPDLLVYLRQHHAEADLERLGALVAAGPRGQDR